MQRTIPVGRTEIHTKMVGANNRDYSLKIQHLWDLGHPRGAAVREELKFLN